MEERVRYRAGNALSHDLGNILGAAAITAALLPQPNVAWPKWAMSRAATSSLNIVGPTTRRTIYPHWLAILFSVV
jgi:hypothetical protein